MLEIADIVLIIFGLGIFTQILLPLLFGKPVFFMFRRGTYEEMRLQQAKDREAAAAKMLEAAKHELQAATLEAQARRAREQALTAQMDGLLDSTEVAEPAPHQEKTHG